MFPSNGNYKSGSDSQLCPKCNTNKDTTEHLVYCYTRVSIAELKKESSTFWAEIVEGIKQFKVDKEKREKEQSRLVR